MSQPVYKVDAHRLLEIFEEAKDRFPRAGLEWGCKEPDAVRDSLLVALADKIQEGGRFHVTAVVNQLHAAHTSKAAGPANRALIWIEAKVKESRIRIAP